MGWFFGFKLHLVINDLGEIMAFKLTPATTDDRIPVDNMTLCLTGKLFGDRGYISQELFDKLFQRGLQLIVF
ncbi:TPA: transposase [Legionella pneumophila]|nr:transposase [Legionella pneumophila]